MLIQSIHWARLHFRAPSSNFLQSFIHITSLRSISTTNRLTCRAQVSDLDRNTPSFDLWSSLLPVNSFPCLSPRHSEDGNPPQGTFHHLQQQHETRKQHQCHALGAVLSPSTLYTMKHGHPGKGWEKREVREISPISMKRHPCCTGWAKLPLKSRKLV